MDFRLSFYNKC